VGGHDAGGEAVRRDPAQALKLTPFKVFQ